MTLDYQSYRSVRYRKRLGESTRSNLFHRNCRAPLLSRYELRKSNEYQKILKRRQTRRLNRISSNKAKLNSPKLNSPKLDSPKLNSPKLDSPKLNSPKLKKDQEEPQLEKLIKNLEQKIKNGDSSISKIKRPKMLIDSLKSLNKIIGMKRLKESAALQVMRLIQALNTGETNLGMLNTILYGKPGVGKTMVAVILAKIWYSLGFLEKNNKMSWAGIIGSSQTDEQLFYLLMFGAYGLYYLYVKIKLVHSVIGIKWLLGLIIVFIIILLIAWCYRDNLMKWADPDYQIPDDSTESNNSGQNIIKVVSREDFVAQYLGQTAGKTKKLLNDNLGKVLFIDEAYSLLNGPTDQYGMEALTTLNLFLEENQDKIVVIFAGYKDMMDRGIFFAQPGLPRRCMWKLECDDYDGDELVKIFFSQLKDKGIELKDSDQVTIASRWRALEFEESRGATIGGDVPLGTSPTTDDLIRDQVDKLIKENLDVFPSFGGDTKRLVFFSELSANKRQFYQESDGEKMLTLADVKDGIHRLRENNIKKGGGKNKRGVSPESLEMLSNLLGNRESSS